ncbi:MAG: dihydropteroate synthase [Lachnospiraceae bacterium]|nr:dihydropteroate synthase [Lachnospiraceae bacterium]
MKIGSHEFDLKNNTYVMGILNITPDSFSDGGSYPDVGAAVKRALIMVDEGADIIDIGGESTRPGHVPVSADEEMSRIVPILEELKKESDIPVSIDTYKAATAKEALDKGADLINDIWGLRYDNGEMAGVIAEAGVPCILMHNRNEAVYNNLLKDMLTDINQTLSVAKAAGIKDDKIILDPGIGFGKTYEDNITVLNNLSYFCETEYPLLLGASRKSVIGNALGLPTDKRVEGTIVTTVLASQAGYSFVRVHDVVQNKRALDMLKAIKQY